MAKTMVRPRSASAWMASQKLRRPSTSMPVVGSSRMSSAGSLTSAMAKRRRCCWPPEHFLTMREAKSVTPARRMASSASIRCEKRLAVSCTVSRTVMSGRRPAVCMTAATSPRSTAWRGLIPKTLASPLVGRLSPRIMSIVVVLPAPLGPRRATTSPGRMVRSIPSTAVTSPKDLCRSVSRTASTWSVRGSSVTVASRLVRGVAVLMAQDSPHVGCVPWPIGHYLLMTYLRGRRVVKYLGMPGENPR